MAKETITSASPPGAGRTLDAYLQMTDGTTVSTAARSVQAVGRPSTLASGSFFSNLGAAGTRVFSRSRLANNYVPATGDGTIIAAGIDHRLTRPTNSPISEEAGAIRVVVTMKVTGVPAVFPSASGPASDWGICFYGNTNLAGMANMQSSAPVNSNAGFSFACNAAGNPVYVTRQTTFSVGAPDEIFVLSAADMTKWCYFDIRFIGATPTSDATLECVLNGQSVLQRNWGAGTLLPTAASIGANFLGAFRPIIGTASGSGITSLQIAFVRVIKGPTFASLF